MEILLTVLDKYGPMGAALVIVCVVLWVIATRVLPSVSESQNKRLDSLTDAIRKGDESVAQKIDANHGQMMQTLTANHGEVMGRFDKIDARQPKEMP